MPGRPVAAAAHFTTGSLYLLSASGGKLTEGALLVGGETTKNMRKSVHCASNKLAINAKGHMVAGTAHLLAGTVGPFESLLNTASAAVAGVAVTDPLKEKGIRPIGEKILKGGKNLPVKSNPYQPDPVINKVADTISGTTHRISNIITVDKLHGHLDGKTNVGRSISRKNTRKSSSANQVTPDNYGRRLTKVFTGQQLANLDTDQMVKKEWEKQDSE